MSTICGTCSGTGVVKHCHNWSTGQKEDRKCWNCSPAAPKVPDLQELHNLLYTAQRQTTLDGYDRAISACRLMLARIRDAMQDESPTHVLVPRVPTDAMAVAATKEALKHQPHTRPLNGMDVWFAMIAAAQGEMNVQLDIDSNHSAPGQQRDVARSVALGQPMGHGPNPTAGDPQAQGDKLLTVAERNIRSFLRSAQFKGESDREAALNCVDVLWAAARAPADSVLEDAALWFAERDNVLHSFWVLLGEAEVHADNDNNPLLKHQVEGFYRQWNALNGTTLGPRWVSRAARKQG